MRRLVVFVCLIVLVGCGGDDESSDPGCEQWEDLLLEQDRGDVSDADAAVAVRQIESAAEDEQVRAAATALAARLEDGEDISAAFQRMGTVCGLD